MTVHVLPNPPLAVEPFDDPSFYAVTIVRTVEDYMQAMTVRSLVYMAEQRCPYEEEFDGNDLCGATHLVLRRCGQPVGTLRIRWFAKFAKVERVSMLREHRRGLGTMIMIGEANRIIRRKGYTTVLAHAQKRLAPTFVKSHGARLAEGRETFVYSDHQYVEIIFDHPETADALTLQADPYVINRPEGAWDEPGVLDRSATRAATNPCV
jgi:predicted GNAT family N-acyltransferase